MSRWQTVGLVRPGEGFPKGTTGEADLGGGVRLSPTTDLFAKEGFVEWLRGALGRYDLDETGYAFVAEYDADSFGERYPEDPRL